MNVLIVGGGGRCHAIAYALKKSEKVTNIHAIPGNPGISEIGTCHNGKVDDFDAILKIIEENDIDLTVVGPEVPLCMGLADFLWEKGHKVFGPRKLASTLEGSKAFSKNFMKKYHIPTANYVEVSNYEDAISSLNKFSYPVVIKADGLAAGKGVVICDDEQMAVSTIKDFMVDGALDGAGNKLVIEEFLEGFECSLLCFTDGNTIVPMVSAKDHKQIFDGNIGPNTGGMGTFSPNPFLNEEMNKIFEEEILNPFMKGLKEEQMDYRGVIFIGLMIKNNKPKVLEFNVRFGDPETQVILLRLESDLFDIMYATTTKTLSKEQVKWKDNVVGCLVLASGGYPGSYEKGKVITGLKNIEKDIVIFHAGTAFKGNEVVTSGGRVLNICAEGKSVEEVRQKIYSAAEKIDFEGKYYRTDIGLV